MTASEWDDFADDWDGDEAVQSYAQQALRSWEERVVPLYPGTSGIKVLDFGCGTGLLTEKLAARCRQVLAVDTSQRMIEALEKKMASSGTGNVLTMRVAIDARSIEEHPDCLGDIDLIVASSVCGFLPDFPATLSVLSSIMKPGAYFVQWDWMEGMPEEKIRAAFTHSGISVHAIAQAFSMGGDGKEMPVIMGIGQKGQPDVNAGIEQ